MRMKKGKDCTIAVCIVVTLVAAGVGLLFMFVPETLTQFAGWLRGLNKVFNSFVSDWMSFLVFLIPMLCVIAGLAPYVFSKK